MLREYGYSKIGTRVIGIVSGQRQPRTSIIGSCVYNPETNQTKLTTAQKVIGTTNGKIFVDYLKTLLPTLTKGQWVVLDNARIHKIIEVKELIDKAGCHLLYLPPYSPDYNPIEHLWAGIKKNLRTMQTTKDKFNENLDYCINKLYSCDRS